MASKRYVMVKRGDCVSCGTCELVCPKQAIQVWNGVCAKVDEDKCIGCGKCERVCPTGCITFVERMSA